MQVDASNIYGDDLTRQLQLRLHKDGKLKYQVLRNLLLIMPFCCELNDKINPQPSCLFVNKKCL